MAFQLCFLNTLKYNQFLRLIFSCPVSRAASNGMKKATTHAYSTDAPSVKKYVPQPRNTFLRDTGFTVPECQAHPGHIVAHSLPASASKSLGAPQYHYTFKNLVEIFGFNDTKKKQKRYRLLLWLCTASAVSGTMPLLYRAICFQEQGLLNNNPNHPLVAPLPNEDDEKTAQRLIQVDFDTCVLSDMQWDFRPSQKRLVITPGETALAFFTATNTADRPVLGYAIYTVTPPEMGQFFNKVQCFCFEEQMLSPGESVDLPVLFYVDPVIMKETRMHHVDRCTLTYIFCESESEVPEEYLEIPHIREQLRLQRISDPVTTDSFRGVGVSDTQSLNNVPSI